jgi:hypothetical protein
MIKYVIITTFLTSLLNWIVNNYPTSHTSHTHMATHTSLHKRISDRYVIKISALTHDLTIDNYLSDKYDMYDISY